MTGSAAGIVSIRDQQPTDQTRNADGTRHKTMTEASDADATTDGGSPVEYQPKASDWSSR